VVIQVRVNVGLTVTTRAARWPTWTTSGTHRAYGPYALCVGGRVYRASADHAAVAALPCGLTTRRSCNRGALVGSAKDEIVRCQSDVK
jgi:hypothetical protein